MKSAFGTAQERHKISSEIVVFTIAPLTHLILLQLLRNFHESISTDILAHRKNTKFPSVENGGENEHFSLGRKRVGNDQFLAREKMVQKTNIQDVLSALLKATISALSDSQLKVWQKVSLSAALSAIVSDAPKWQLKTIVSVQAETISFGHHFGNTESGAETIVFSWRWNYYFQLLFQCIRNDGRNLLFRLAPKGLFSAAISAHPKQLPKVQQKGLLSATLSARNQVYWLNISSFW